MVVTENTKTCTIIEVIEGWVKKDKNQIAVQMETTEGWQKYSYEQMWLEVEKAKKRFIKLGLEPGSRVIILAPNSPKWVISLLAIFACGSTAALLDPRMEVEELNELLDRSDAQMILTTNSFYYQIDPKFGKKIPILDLDNSWYFFYELLEDVIQCPSATEDGNSSIACLLFTSGTTDNYKGVLITHESILHVMEEAKRIGEVIHTDQSLAILPSTHIYGLILTILAPMSVGSTITFVETISGPNVIKAMSETHTTVLLCVPRILDLFYAKIMNEIESKPAHIHKGILLLMKLCGFLRKKTGLNFGRVVFKKIHDAFGGALTRLVSGAASLDTNVHKKMEALGFTIIEGYGLTETCSLVSCNTLDNRVIGSVGRLINEIEVMIKNPNENGEGEICIRGPNLMKGYFRDREATHRAIRHGWFHTGDLGRFDRDNNLYITGRIKELIICSNGENVMPQLLERKFHDIAGIKDLAVVGVKFNGLVKGEAIHAAIVLSDEAKKDENSKEKIKDQIEIRSEKLPYEQKIRQVHFLEDIPKTTTLKVKRKILKNQIELMIQGKEINGKEHNGYAPKHRIDELAIRELIINLIKNVLTTSREGDIPHDIDEETSLQFDLDFDSLMYMELLHQTREKLGVIISEDELPNLKKVKHIIAIVRKGQEKNLKEEPWNVTIRDYLKDPEKYPLKEKIQLETGFWKKTMLMSLLAWFGNYFSINITGKENLKKSNAANVIFANHASHMDALTLIYALELNAEDYVIFAREESFSEDGKPKSKLLEPLNLLPFTREMSSDKILRNIQLFKKCIDEGKKVIIFPEGTRSVTGKLLPFRSFIGLLAKEMNITLLPVFIEGGHKLMPKGSNFPKRGEVDVIIGEPITFETLTQFDENNKMLNYHQVTELLRQQTVKLRDFHRMFKKK